MNKIVYIMLKIKIKKPKFVKINYYKTCNKIFSEYV